MNEELLEQTISDFEQEFAQGRQPELETWLQRFDFQEQLFDELLHIDLEMRIRQGQDVHVEEYLTRFPQLQRQWQRIGNLLETEFKIRSAIEPGLDTEKFLTRFPEIALDFDIAVGGSALNEDDAKQASYSDRLSRFRKNALHRSGGLGMLWKAQDLELDRNVAVKEIKPKFRNDPAFRNKFARETLISSKLEHPGIVPVYGMGQMSNGTPYFAMQFIEGKTLREAIGDFHNSHVDQNNLRTSIQFRRLIQHFIDVCNTIEYAHSQGVIHRDIKPENIMLGKFGETYVVDWGLAKVTDQPSDAQASTSAVPTIDNRYQLDSSFGEDSVDGQAVGSLGFMSPEQAEGRLDQIDFRTDIFSLGATLWSIVSGQKQPSAIPDADGFSSPDQRTLRSICRKAMAIQPQNRYTNPTSLVADVEKYMLDQPVEAHHDSAFEKINRFSRNNRLILNSGLIALALISLVSLASAFWIDQERDRAVAAEQAEIEERKKVETALQQKELALQQKDLALQAEQRALRSEEEARASAENTTKNLTRSLTHLIASVSRAQLDAVPLTVTSLDDISVSDFLSCADNVGPNKDNLMVAAFTSICRANNAYHTKDHKNAERFFYKGIEALEAMEMEETDLVTINSKQYLAMSLYASKKYSKAENVLNSLVQSLEKMLPAGEQRVRFLYLNAIRMQGKVFFKLKKLKEVEKAYSKLFAMRDDLLSLDDSSLVYLDLLDGHQRILAYFGKFAERERILNVAIGALEDKKFIYPEAKEIEANVRIALIDNYLNKGELESAKVLNSKFVEVAAKRMVESTSAATRNQTISSLQKLHKLLERRRGPVDELTIEAAAMLVSGFANRGTKSDFRQIIDRGEAILKKVYDPKLKPKQLNQHMVTIVGEILPMAYLELKQTEKAEKTVSEFIEFVLEIEGDDSVAAVNLKDKFRRLQTPKQ